jgi:biotin carboxyl carrier protein
MGPLRKNLGSRIPNAAAASNSANSNVDVTLQSLAAAYEELTARLSALEQLQLENARLLELTNTQANEIASLRAQLAAQPAGAPMDTPSSTAAASSPAPSNGAKETVSSPSLGTAASSWATIASRGSKNKLRRHAAAARSFQPVSGDQGFEYVYIPGSRRMSYSEARRRLGVDNWRALDVCFPAYSAASLLVHLQCRLQDPKLWCQQVFLLLLFRCKNYLTSFKSWNKESPTMMVCFVN